MPFTVPITLTNPPLAPPGYTLCAFEVRICDAEVGAAEGLKPVVAFPGTRSGFEDAAKALVKAVLATLRDASPGLRIAAVAWWVDANLTDATNGRERLVSVYDAGEDEWGKWTPEERIGEPGKASSITMRASTAQGVTKFKVGSGARE